MLFVQNGKVCVTLQADSYIMHVWNNWKDATDHLN